MDGRTQLLQGIAGMADERQKLVTYLSAVKNGLWKWSEGGRVIVWCDSTTVAFREEIEEILKKCSVSGVPPFGGLVMLLAMCRKIEMPDEQVYADMLGVGPLACYAGGIHELEKFPRAVMASTSGKAVLVEMVFEQGLKLFRTEYANALMDVLPVCRFTDDELNAAQQSKYSNNELVRLIYHRLKQIAPEALALRLPTGLDELPGPADEDLLPSERVRRLLDELRNDDEHSGMARVTRDIMAALQLPRKLSEMDDMAMGGFSDITNRGQLDRLLVSELAHDDLTLAVRVALNEALYIRREPPMRHPPTSLSILLDTGIRLWGIPRVLATSVALAVAAKDPNREEICAYRPTDDGVEPVDLFTRDGLVAHLTQLTTAPHPGASLRAFFGSCGRQQMATEAMIIVASDTMRDPEFRRMLDESAPDGILYVATVERTGQFELYQYPVCGKSPMARAVIDVDKLFGERKGRQTPLVDKTHDPSLPVILGMKPFPLLLPVLKHAKHVLCFDEGGGVAVVDRSLAWWKSGNRGVTTVVDELPAGMVLFAQLWAPGVVRMVIGSCPADCTLLEIDLERGLKSDIRPEWVDDDRPSDFCVLPDGSLCFVCSYSVYVVKWSADEKPFLLELASATKHVAGRYFEEYFDCYGDVSQYVHWDGEQAILEELPYFPSYRVPFDRWGIEGQFFFTPDCVKNFAGEHVFTFDGPYSLVKVSPDGHQLLVKKRGVDALSVLHLKTATGKPKLIAGSATFAIHDLNDFSRVPMHHNVRRRFERVGISENGKIILATHKAKSWLELDLTGGQIVLKDTDRPGIELTGFQSVKSPGRYLLHAATWTGRTRFYLDSRGMLHLKSHDSSLPEVSIVLQEGLVAAWSSDGLLCGTAFYTDRNDTETDRNKWQAMWNRIMDITRGAT